jgi:hypothetical protein
VTDADIRRAFIVEMGVLAALIGALIAYLHGVSADWRGSHIGMYGYMALYAVVVTQLTFFLVAFTATP